MAHEEKIRILLVDDKPETLLALEMILEDLHEEVVKVHSGKEALRRLLKEDFAVILLDVNMPGMDGFETAEFIRQRKRSERTPIIFLTAFSDEIYVERGYSLGAVDYILAPVVPEILRAKVGVFVDLYRKTRQLRRQADSLQQRATQLHALTQASLAITSAPSLEAIRRVLEEWARTLVGADRASAIFDLEDPGRSDTSPPEPALVPEPAGGAQADVPERVSGQVPERRIAVHQDHVIVPLVGRAGHAIGRLHVSDKPIGQMTADDEAVLVQLAQIASIAMENVISARQLAAEIKERQEAMDQLKQSHAQLRDLAMRLESVREEERTRIAHEIHDELGQTLTGLKLDLALVRQEVVKADSSLERVQSMSTLIDTAIQTVRNIATELRPVVLDQFGLLPAIEWLTNGYQSRTGIRFKLNFYMRHLHLTQDRSTAVFRIVQEILTNVVRHANANTVTLTVRECGGHVLIEATDDGRGITEAELADPKSLGLLGMRQRASLLGGDTVIKGIPGKGTVVTVTMPLSAAGVTGVN